LAWTIPSISSTEKVADNEGRKALLSNPT
jgi:hypothetical protein